MITIIIIVVVKIVVIFIAVVIVVFLDITVQYYRCTEVLPEAEIRFLFSG